jgi:cytochrome c oxidase subunit 1
MVAMFFGFMTYLVPRTTGALLPFGFWLYLVGGSVFVLSFLAAGSVSVPRRYAVHLPEWLPYDRVASIGAALTVLGALILVLNFVIGLPSAMREEAEA